MVLVHVPDMSGPWNDDDDDDTYTHTHTHIYNYIYKVYMYIHRYPHIRYLPTNTPDMCSTYAFTLFGIIESQRADD